MLYIPELAFSARRGICHPPVAPTIMPLLSEVVQPGEELLSGHVQASPGSTLRTHSGTFRIHRILRLHNPYTPAPYSGIPACPNEYFTNPVLPGFCASMLSLRGYIGSRTSVADRSTPNAGASSHLSCYRWPARGRSGRSSLCVQIEIALYSSPA